jgi:hypothetical protein
MIWAGKFIDAAILTSSATGSRLRNRLEFRLLAPSSISAEKRNRLKQEKPLVAWIAQFRMSALTVLSEVCCFYVFCWHSRCAVYLDAVSHGNTGWPIKILVDDIPDIENITAALKTGPYGSCVYENDNDVCDHQVVNLEFENGSTASFTMVAFTSSSCKRQLRMHFTHGEIVGDMTTFKVTDFRQRTTTTRSPRGEGGGHGGGDLGLIATFVEAVRVGEQEVLGTNIDQVLQSHMTVFAAETSRKEGRVVSCVEFEQQAREAYQGTNVAN